MADKTSRFTPARFSLSRRDFLKRSLSTAGALSLGVVAGKMVRVPSVLADIGGGADSFGPLLPPDQNGLRLPSGFTSRIIARASQPVAPSNYAWPIYPDGGATFETEDGGWIYVANSERDNGLGGVSAVRFGQDGTILDAYSILSGTDRNCAGGPTPWGTWLSCEEVTGGQVWECDPFSPSQGVLRPALGAFRHEAAAVDPVHQQVYLTEDQVDGLLYRFSPDNYPDLTSGSLEVAQILDPEGEGPILPGQVRPLAWLPLINASPPGGGVESAVHRPAGERATRFQAGGATTFLRGEGAWYEGGIVYFTTTGDNRVWALDTAAQTIEIIYDFATSDDPELFGADNVVASRAGDVYVAEDGGNMQIVALTAGGDVKPVVEITDQPDSEVVGPALSPDGLRMYFSSQRGPTPNGDWGVTYEVTGPFAPYPSNAGDGSIGARRISLSSSPNPFASRTQISYTLVDAGHVRIRIHDVHGRVVRTLVDGYTPAGRHVVSWDGRTDMRAPAASGVYLVRLETRGHMRSLKVNFRR